MKGKVLVVALACGASGVAFADTSDLDTGEYFFAVPFYSSPGDDRGVDDGFGFGAGYGKRWTENLFWEFQISASAMDTDDPGRTGFYNYGGGIDLSYQFSPGGWTPFALVGLGGMYNDVIPESDDGFSAFANVGLGLLSAPLDNGIRFRFEGRYAYDTFEYASEDGMSDWRVGLGVQIPLGERVVEKEVVREKVLTKEVPVEIVDSDGDGVPDRNDDCPDTLEGLATDAHGCADQSARQSVRLAGVTFALDSARLKPESRETLETVVRALKGDPDMRVEIAGHTDSQGAAAYNRQLSQRRAESVRGFLLREGISPERVRARGYGESEPVASNDTAAGRARNRRVEFRVLN